MLHAIYKTLLSLLSQVGQQTRQHKQINLIHEIASLAGKNPYQSALTISRGISWEGRLVSLN